MIETEINQAKQLCFEARDLLKSASKQKHNAGLMSSAGNLYLKASKLDPHAAEPYLGLAVILYSAGKFEKAMGLVEQASQLEPVNRRVAQLKKRCLKALEKGDVQPSSSTAKTVQFNLPVSPLKLLRTLKRDIDSPRILFKLVEQIYNKKLSKNQATIVFHLISTGTIDGEKEATQKDEVNLGNLLKSLNENLGFHPEIFAQELKNRLKSFHRLRFFTQIKPHIISPKDLFQAVKQCFNVELSKSQATVLFHLVQTQTIDGKTRPSTLDKLNLADIVNDIVKNQQAFGEQMQELVMTLDKYFKSQS